MLTIPFIFGFYFALEVFVTIPDVDDKNSPTVKVIKQAIYHKYSSFFDEAKSIEDIVIFDYDEVASLFLTVADTTLIETMTSINCLSKFGFYSFIYLH